MLKTLFFVILTSLTLLANADPLKTIPKKIQMYVPYSPGGVVDFQFRHLSQYLSTKGIILTALYKPGGNSVVAASEFINADKDGSVIMINSTSNSWHAEQRLGKKVIEPIISTGGTANAIITYPGSKYENFEDFIISLKSGDTDLKIGWPAAAILLYIHQLTDTIDAPKPLTVPYKTPSDAARDVVGKHLPVAVVSMAVALPLVDAKKIKIISGFSAGTSGLPKDIFNVNNKYPNLRHNDIFFIGLPPGTDEKIVNAWLELLKEYLTLKETSDAYAAVYLGRNVGGVTHINDLIRRQSESIKKHNIEF